MEIDVPEEVTDWTVAPPSPGSIEGPEGGTVTVTGTVIGVGEEDDPVVELRVGDGILLVETDDSRRALAPGGSVAFRTSRILLHPYDL
ncbi:hypothetical protein [Streptacidiphilus cavernicola]|uniref:Uncharacterized protein n=1 Tax=Streptacidiphilus cavernicola TaxID=3342716 RepID=A0ABV6VSK8_9ACTN